MARAKETPASTVEERLRAAQGVLLLVADLLDRSSGPCLRD